MAKDSLSIKMCGWLIAVLGGVLLTGCSSMLNSHTTPPQIYVDVTGSGRDPRIALDEALRNAVGVASGVLISSKIQLVNEKIVKDEISEFSAGYVSWYEVKKTYSSNGLTYVEVGALISSSKLLSDYVFEKSLDGKVAGDQLYAKAATFLRSKAQGDRLLKHLADSYPLNALSISLGKTSISVANDRVVWLVVPYRIAWAKGFLDAFSETVSYLSQSKCFTGTDKFPKRCEFNIGVYDGSLALGNGIGYTLSDTSQERILFQKFNDEIGLDVMIEEAGGIELGRICKNLKLPWKFLANQETKLSLYASEIQGVMRLELRNPEDLVRIASVKLSATETCLGKT